MLIKSAGFLFLFFLFSFFGTIIIAVCLHVHSAYCPFGLDNIISVGHRIDFLILEMIDSQMRKLAMSFNTL